jgi:hypothetical protein
MNNNIAAGRYGVLSPWAEADPKPAKGLTPRLKNLLGKKIGFYCNSKRAAQPITKAIEEKLKDRYPDIKTSWYYFTRVSIPEIETNKDKFEEWIKGVDVVIGAVGD